MGMQSPDFDSIKQVNVYGMEFWSARDLMPLLGYGKNWRNFTTAIEKAKIACQENGHIIENHFDASIKMVKIGSATEREVDDYLLSRLACYLIAMNGNPRKPEIAAAQNYFAVSTRAHEMEHLRQEQEARLEARLRVSESYKQLGQTAQEAGVQSESFGVFIDASYMGLHHHTLQELRSRKQVPEKEDYLDVIGREELSAIDFKNALTNRKIQDDNVTGLDEASRTHYFVGDQIRQTIKRIRQPMPEDMPTGPSIRKMVEERRRKQKRLQQGTSEGGDEMQDRLF